MSQPKNMTTIASSTTKSPSLWLVALASVFLMGLGQFINRQWAKGVLFLLIFVAFLGIEFGTGAWQKMDLEYKSDYVQYFGQVANETVEGQSATLTEAVGKPSTISDPLTSLLPLKNAPDIFEAGFVQVSQDFGSGNLHGFLLPTALAQGLILAKTGTEPAEIGPDQLKILDEITKNWSTTATEKLGPLVGQTLTVTPRMPQAFTGTTLGDSTDPVVRVRYNITVDDVDYAYFAEYFPPALAQQAVGPVPREGEVRYPVRDYGGYITRSIWGMITLGALVINDEYRGVSAEARNAERPWAQADDSSKLLARGLIASVLVLFLVLAWFMNVLDAYNSRKTYLATGKVQGFVSYLKELWERAYVWILIAPSLVLISFFTVIPFLYTFLCSFTNWTYKVLLSQQLITWQGIHEYLVVFAEPAWLSVFFQVFLWTILWALASSVTVYVMGFAHALVIESPLIKGKKIWRTILIIPWAMPALISLLAFRNVFDKDGLMNQVLLATNLMKPVSDLLYGIGLEGKPDNIIFWFDPPYNANLAKFVAIMVNLWLGAPYFMMLMTGIMSTIPADRYEAAMIDGASAFQKFRYITLPLVLTATIPAMVMTVTFNFNNFGAVYFLTGGGPTWLLENLPQSLKTWSSSLPGQTDILISWIYKISFNANSQLYNKAAVYTVFIFLILGIFSVVNMRMTKAFDDEGEE
ncbi:MAG: ABC transporter permease subunit [Spirochaetales bacterium]